MDYGGRLSSTPGGGCRLTSGRGVVAIAVPVELVVDGSVNQLSSEDLRLAAVAGVRVSRVG